MEQEIIVMLNDIRKEKGLGFGYIAEEASLSVRTVTRFFALQILTNNEILGKRIAYAMGLPINLFDTCEGAIIDYYKNKQYFTPQEKLLIEQWRRLSDNKKNLIASLLADWAEGM